MQKFLGIKLGYPFQQMKRELDKAGKFPLIRQNEFVLVEKALAVIATTINFSYNLLLPDIRIDSPPIACRDPSSTNQSVEIHP